MVLVEIEELCKCESEPLSIPLRKIETNLCPIIDNSVKIDIVFNHNPIENEQKELSVNNYFKLITETRICGR